MEKEIIQEDLQRVSTLLRNVLNIDRYAEIERMGGLTNHTYKVILEDGREIKDAYFEVRLDLLSGGRKYLCDPDSGRRDGRTDYTQP